MGGRFAPDPVADDPSGAVDGLSLEEEAPVPPDPVLRRVAQMVASSLRLPRIATGTHPDAPGWWAIIDPATDRMWLLESNPARNADAGHGDCPRMDSDLYDRLDDLTVTKISALIGGVTRWELPRAKPAPEG